MFIEVNVYCHQNLAQHTWPSIASCKWGPAWPWLWMDMRPLAVPQPIGVKVGLWV